MLQIDCIIVPQVFTQRINENASQSIQPYKKEAKLILSNELPN